MDMRKGSSIVLRFKLCRGTRTTQHSLHFSPPDLNQDSQQHNATAVSIRSPKGTRKIRFQEAAGHLVLRLLAVRSAMLVREAGKLQLPDWSVRTLAGPVL